jgi:hypothetical protein
MQLLNLCNHKTSLDGVCAMQHHGSCLLYLLQGNRFSPLSSGLFFAPMLAAKTKKPPALANRRLSGFWW